MYGKILRLSQYFFSFHFAWDFTWLLPQSFTSPKSAMLIWIILKKYVIIYRYAKFFVTLLIVINIFILINTYQCIAVSKFISITRIIKMSKLKFSNMYLRYKQKIPSFRPSLPSCTSYLQDHGLTATDVSCWSYLQCLDMWFRMESF